MGKLTQAGLEGCWVLGWRQHPLLGLALAARGLNGRAALCTGIVPPTGQVKAC